MGGLALLVPLRALLASRAPEEFMPGLTNGGRTTFDDESSEWCPLDSFVASFVDRLVVVKHGGCD